MDARHKFYDIGTVFFLSSFKYTLALLSDTIKLPENNLYTVYPLLYIGYMCMYILIHITKIYTYILCIFYPIPF